MAYKIDYSSREKDNLICFIEGEEYLSGIKTASNIASNLYSELSNLYNELCECLKALQSKIQALQQKMAKAHSDAQQSYRRAVAAQEKLRNTPTSKVVYPSKEEAARGAEPRRVPVNQDVIASLGAEVSSCQADIQRQQQIIQEIEGKIAYLNRDVETIKSGISRVQGYQEIARDAIIHLETAYRESKDKCEREVLPVIKEIEKIMEQYGDIRFGSVSYRNVPHISAKEWR